MLRGLVLSRIFYFGRLTLRRFPDLATHCRLLLHDHPRHPKLVRRCVLYPLYVFAEIAIISTDLAELLGSAIGLCLLFPKLPLWAGVVLTAADVLIFLMFSDPSRGHGRPVKVFEYTVIGLVRLASSIGDFCLTILHKLRSSLYFHVSLRC